MTNIQLFEPAKIQNLIYTIRGEQVMLDSDLAKVYGVETRVLNQAVARNISRFPENFRFQLTKEKEQKLRSQFETSIADHLCSQHMTLNKNANLKSQIVISSGKHGERRKLPYVFTEQGIAMLSAVLRSETAIQVSIQIMDAFVAMRKFIGSNARLFQRLDQIEQKQLTDKTEIDKNFDRIFDAIEQKEIAPKQGIIYEWQIFNAHTFISKIIKSAKQSIIIIDNYIVDSVLTLLTDRQKDIHIKIITKSVSKRLVLSIKKFKEQFGQIVVEEQTNCHDKFFKI